MTDIVLPPGAKVAMLCGYPRSGAALVRTILGHCFGHKTGSVYIEADIGESYAEAVQLWDRPQTAETMQALVDAQGLLTYKTHERPRDREPGRSIMIVRDGRRTMESLQAFYADNHALNVSMMDMVRGDHPWGCWSAWHRAWAAVSRSDSVWLRYEDIMADVPATVDRLAKTFDIEPIGYEIPPFEAQVADTPAIFRKAETTGNGGMTEAEEAAFWSLHRGTMEMMGYRDDR